VVIAMIPIMVAIAENLLPGGETLTVRGWLGTATGAIGMFVLVWPRLHSSGGLDRQGIEGFLILVVAAVAFAAGSILSRRFHFKADTFVATAWQLGCASACNFVAAGVGGNFHHANWTLRGVLAIVYLAVFGSVVGLTAYVYLLKHVPVTKVSTYAFVNPVIAVLIGVVTLHERLAPAELLGMFIILISVATVILSRTKAPPVPSDPMLEVPIEE